VKNLGDPLQASHLGNFHCDNCFWTSAETRCSGEQLRAAAGVERGGVPSSSQKRLKLPSIYMIIKKE
jgi:hypothetical protein